MTRVRSSPFIVRVVIPSLASGDTVWSVMTPSMRTLFWPLTVTATTTRTRGIGIPEASKKMVCRGDWMSILNTSSNPLTPVALLITLTESRASITSSGTATGSMGPIIRVRFTPRKIAVMAREPLPAGG